MHGPEGITHYYDLEFVQVMATHHKVPEGRFNVSNPCSALCTLRGVEQRVDVSGKSGLGCFSLGDGRQGGGGQSCHIFHDGGERRHRMMAMCQVRQLACKEHFSTQGSSTSAGTDLPLGDASGLVHSWIEKRPGNAS
jgi:hypothetical protein